jgi:hypothetical protein
MEVVLQDIRTIEQFDPRRQNWRKQNDPAEFCTDAALGQRHYFVKRQQRLFNGWRLLHAAISDEQIKHTARVVSLAKNDDYYYYFAEQLNGTTLDERLKQSALPKDHLEKLANTVFSCVEHINQKGFWYTDLCPKNIFASTNGEYFLLDLDSCYPHSLRLRDLIDPKSRHKSAVSNDYTPLLSEFAKKAGGITGFNINHHSGECVNQAQLVAIAVDIKSSFKIPIEKKNSVIHIHLTRMLKTEYFSLFSDLVRCVPDWLRARNLVQNILQTNWP